MLYWLQDDQEAGPVFFGTDPELLKIRFGKTWRY